MGIALVGQVRMGVGHGAQQRMAELDRPTRSDAQQAGLFGDRPDGYVGAESGDSGDDVHGFISGASGAVQQQLSGIGVERSQFFGED